MSSFFDSLYSQFLLRDLLATVVPGFISLAAISVLLVRHPLELVERLSRVHTLVTLGTLYGISFMIAMLFQFVGERLGLLVIFIWRENEELDARQDSLEHAQNFLRDKGLTDNILRQRERFAILKEMSGNFGMSMLVVAVTAFARALASRPSAQAVLLMAVLVLIGIAFLLFRQNRHHAQEQLIWERHLIEPR